MEEQIMSKSPHGKEIYKRIRCMRCTHRIELEQGQKEAWCPHCGLGWVITWVTPDIPMVLRRIMVESPK